MKVLIIGGGISGITLAHLCEDRGIDYHVIDQGQNSSSSIAAGIINPMVFRRMTLSWRADELVSVADSFYHAMERKLGARFYHPIVIRRLFASEQEAGYWIKKQDVPEYAPFMSPQTEEDRHFPSPLNTFGTGVVLGCSYIDAGVYCNAQWNWLENQGKLTHETVAYDAIDPEKGSYNGIAYDYLIFSEGKDGIHNPWFNHLPLQQTKGEILTIHAPTISQEELLNRKCFLLPIGNGNFKAGSTYVWDSNDLSPTEEARILIEENITSVTTESFTVVEQTVGIRPTVKDRRPLLGKHATFPQLVIANGLGAKGYLLAPLLLNELLDHVVDGKPLHPESDIKRIKKR